MYSNYRDSTDEKAGWNVNLKVIGNEGMYE